MNNFYDDFSLFYDKYDANNYSIRLGKSFLQYLKENYPDEPMARHLDICCGTGRLCGFMKEQGIDTFGYDLSAGMVNKARSNYPDIEFKIADATKYSDEKTYDFATCTADALNHLLEPSMLKAAFSKTANVLRTGGFFFFDMDDPNSTELFDGQPIEIDLADDEEIIFQIWRPSKTEFKGKMKHVKSGKVDWEGDIFERLYEKDEIEQYLEEAGLTLIECRKELYDVHLPKKNIFIARK